MPRRWCARTEKTACNPAGDGATSAKIPTTKEPMTTHLLVLTTWTTLKSSRLAANHVDGAGAAVVKRQQQVSETKCIRIVQQKLP
jgi:hypothetical protein